MNIDFQEPDELDEFMMNVFEEKVVEMLNDIEMRQKAYVTDQRILDMVDNILYNFMMNMVDTTRSGFTTLSFLRKKRDAPRTFPRNPLEELLQYISENYDIKSQALDRRIVTDAFRFLVEHIEECFTRPNIDLYLGYSVKDYLERDVYYKILKPAAECFPFHQTFIDVDLLEMVMVED